MSNELSYQFNTRLALDGIWDTFVVTTRRVDQTTNRVFRNVQQIGTTEEALMTGDVVTPGYCAFLNLDDTNYVEVGSQDTGGGLPVNSKLKIAADGTPYMQNATTGLWHAIQVDGPDGNVYWEIDQIGAAAPVSTGVFYPFLKILPGERCLCRVGVAAADLYAKANGGNVELFYIVYDS